MGAQFPPVYYLKLKHKEKNMNFFYLPFNI